MSTFSKISVTFACVIVGVLVDIFHRQLGLSNAIDWFVITGIFILCIFCIKFLVGYVEEKTPAPPADRRRQSIWFETAHEICRDRHSCVLQRRIIITVHFAVIGKYAGLRTGFDGWFDRGHRGREFLLAALEKNILRVL